jgi:hypothetical protein
LDDLPKDFGISGLIWIGTSREYTYERGWTSTIIYKGSHADVEGSAQAWAAKGYSVSTEHVEGTPKSTLRVTVGGLTPADEPPPVTPNPDVPAPPIIWSLIATDEETNMAQHPLVTDKLDDLTTTQLSDIYKWVKAIKGGTNMAEPPWFADADNRIIKEYARGVARDNLTTFHQTRWVLRKVQVVAPNSSLKQQHAKALYVFTTAELIAAESIPATIRFNLPDGEWLKLAGTTEQLQDGRFQFTQEFLFGTAGDWDDEKIPVYIPSFVADQPPGLPQPGYPEPPPEPPPGR